MTAAKRRKFRLPSWAHTPGYLAGRALSTAVFQLPLSVSAPLARVAARRFASSFLNRKRLFRARDNIAFAFPERGPEWAYETAIRSYEHLFALGVETGVAPRLLSEDGWHRHLRLGDIAGGVRSLLPGRPCVQITGHCGNWELLGTAMAFLGFPVHALYRPMDSKPLDRWVRETRSRRGLTLVDKFGAVRQLPRILRSGGPVGFVADQNGGDRGTFVPYFGRLTSTYKSIGLLALQFNATILCGFARRMAAGERPDGAGRSRALQYIIEVADIFGPEDWSTHPDPLFYLTARYRRAIEAMVRRAPEQYLWMHRIWRSRPRHERSGRPFPASLREKIRLLPWTTAEDLARLEEQSARDAATLAATGQDRFS